MTTAVQEMNLEGGYTIKGLFQELKKMWWEPQWVSKREKEEKEVFSREIGKS
jgi:hypothetical protein